MSAPESERRAAGWREFLLASLAFTVAIALLYAPTLGGHYQADDFGAVSVRTDSDGDPKIAATLEAFYKPTPPNADWRFHRPLWGASLLLEAGPLAGLPWASRVLSVLLHAVGAALIVWILRRRGAAALPSYLAAAAFALGPGSAQAVAWIVARCDSMATTFGLAAVAARLLLHESQGTRRVLWRAASLVALTAAIWSKESGYAFVPALLVLSVLDGPGTFRRRLVQGALRSLDVLVLAVALFLWRAAMVGGAVGGYVGAQHMLPFSVHLDKTALGMFPAGLIDNRVVASMAIAVLLAGLVVLLWRSSRSLWGLAVVGLVLFAASLGATMHVYVTSYDSADNARIHHQPAAAWALAVGAALAAGWAAWPRRGVRVAIAGVGVAATALAVGSNWPLVQGHAAAGQLAGDVVAALREVAGEPHRGQVVLRGVPDKLGPGLVGRNLVGSALAPLVVHPAPAHILLGNEIDAALPGGLQLAWLPALLGRDGTTRAWDPSARRFSDSEGWGALHVRGHVERWRPEDPKGEPRLRLLTAPLELTGPEAEQVLQRPAALDGQLVEVVLDPKTRLRSQAVLRALHPIPPGLLVAPPAAEGEGASLKVRGPPRSRVVLLVGERAGWRPLGELGTCLIAAPRLVMVGLVGGEGRLDVNLNTLRAPGLPPPRFVQALVTVTRDVAWISERLELNPADFAGDFSSPPEGD